MPPKNVALPNDVGKEWNVIWNKSDKYWSSSPECITCKYPKGGFASDCGTSFRSEPRGIFPGDDVTLAYEVFVPKDFDFVQGGKLPGFYMGAPGSGGGDWNNDGASCRLMFREGGVVVAYVYLCLDIGKYNGTASCPVIHAQGSHFKDIAHFTGDTGIDLWRDEKTPLQLKKGAWNTIRLRVKLNSSGDKADGIVSVSVNGGTKTFEGMRWTQKPAEKRIGGIAFCTWMGGGSKEYAPKADHILKFRTFQLTSQ